MKKIFCLMGKSSSGKDTIFGELLLDNKLELKPLITYTTRPIRSNEVQGREYFFIDEATLEEYLSQNKVIEKRVYHTVNGDWYYCTVDDGQIDLATHHFLGITTLEAFQNLQNYFGKEKVVALYIEVEDGVRLSRAIERERKLTHPNYEELCRRFLADSIDFSEENLTKAGITIRFNNEEYNECVQLIQKEIERYS